MTDGNFARTLLRWYDAHGRDLPWRRTRDPYAILVSEIMLQQTQVPRVILKWKEWLEKFPTAQSLAKASQREVILAWAGLGYNSRALRLKQCCEHVAEHGWPRDPEGLQALPGIGKYTAHAIACFAFGKRVALVDINVKLVLSPFIGPDADDKTAWAHAAKLLPQERFYDYNQALFDLGTVIRSGDLSSLPLEFQRMYAGVEFKRKKSAEKLHGGYPMRLYRGALVQFLRETDGHSATLSACKRRLGEKLAAQSEGFVLAVARNLEKDGIVTCANGRVTLR